MLPGDGGWRPPDPPEPTQVGCTPIVAGPTGTAQPVLSRAGGPSASTTTGGWETLTEAHAEAQLQFLSFGCFCGLVESCDCAGLCVTVAEPSARSSAAVPVCGLTLGVWVCIPVPV